MAEETVCHAPYAVNSVLPDLVYIDGLPDTDRGAPAGCPGLISASKMSCRSAMPPDITPHRKVFSNEAHGVEHPDGHERGTRRTCRGAGEARPDSRSGATVERRPVQGVSLCSTQGVWGVMHWLMVDSNSPEHAGHIRFCEYPRRNGGWVATATSGKFDETPEMMRVDCRRIIHLGAKRLTHDTSAVETFHPSSNRPKMPESPHTSESRNLRGWTTSACFDPFVQPNALIP